MSVHRINERLTQQYPQVHEPEPLICTGRLSQSLDTARRAGPPPITKKPVQKKFASSAGYSLLEPTLSFEAQGVLCYIIWAVRRSITHRITAHIRELY